MNKHGPGDPTLWTAMNFCRTRRRTPPWVAIGETFI